MNRLRCAFFGIVGAAVVFGATPPASAQEAVSITAVGWWTQRPGASALPDDGFEIAGAPGGPISEAALRVEVRSAQISFALLELTESSQVLGSVAGINACPTTDAWKPANPGPWSDAPAPRCESAEVSLSRSDTGLWTGDVSRLLRAGSVSIVLVGVPATSGGAPIAFQTVFSGARLTASAPSSPTTPPAEPPEPAPFDPPQDMPESLPPPPPATTEVIPPAPAAAPPSGPVRDVAAPASGEVGADSETAPWWRLLFLVPLSIVAGVAAIVVRRLAQERGWSDG